MKKVLWITSCFPPRVNVATKRNVKFLKYLPRFGWEAVVICPKEISRHTKTSQQLMNQLCSAITVSPMCHDTFCYLQDRKYVHRLARYMGYFMNNIIPPDGHIFWSLLVLNRIGKEIIKYKPDIVYTTCSPFSINLIGAWIKFKYKLPWVTDFRDLWTLNPMHRRFLKSYYNLISNILERYYLRYCNALIVNTEVSQARMIEKHPFLKDKIWVIPNGFDLDDIHTNNKNSSIPNSFFYGGSIDCKSNYTPLPILKLLSKLEENSHLNEPRELHYAGNEGKTFIDLCNQAGIGIKYKVIIHGYLEHPSFYQLIRCMAYVMLCMPSDIDTTSWIPARLYDYMGNKCRIICLASRDSEVVRVLEQYGNGLILFYDESEDIQIQKLQAFLVADRIDKNVSDAFIKRFSRKKLTMRLSKVFNLVTDG